MSRNKHPKTGPKDRPRDDIVDDPGIGRSKGAWATGTDPRDLDGGSTTEGDVANETTREGGVDPGHLGRTNK